MKILMAGLMLTIVLLAPLPAMAQNNGQPPPRPSIGLALGSGGAGGLAHIAMLQVFDDLELKPDRIVGTSIGAVIGALYAAGLSAEEIYDIFDDFGGSHLDVLSQLMRPNAELSLGTLLKIGLDEGGLFDPAGFLEYLAGKIKARTFAELAIPLELIATDYWSGETVELNQGDLFAAVRASMAVPGLFAPVQLGEKLLIDGGTSNPLPFNLLQDHYDIVVAIDVSGSRTRKDSDETGLTELLFNTFEIMQQAIISAQMRVKEPDIYIEPDTSDIRLLHFNRIEAILEQAQPAAESLQRQLSKTLGAEQ